MKDLFTKDMDIIYVALAGILACSSIASAIRQIDNPRIVLINLMVGVVYLLACVLFYIREEIKLPPTPLDVVVGMASFFSPMYVWLGTYLPPNVTFKNVGTVVYCVGTSVVIASLYSLRKSFGVLPAVRTIIDSGIYKYVRHPMYLGELVQIVGILLMHVNAVSVLGVCVAVPLYLWRIHLEEVKLSTQRAYRRYSSRVNYRLVPYLW